jgi:hypothetical protein
MSSTGFQMDQSVKDEESDAGASGEERYQNTSSQPRWVAIDPIKNHFNSLIPHQSIGTLRDSGARSVSWRGFRRENLRDQVEAFCITYQSTRVALHGCCRTSNYPIAEHIARLNAACGRCSMQCRMSLGQSDPRRASVYRRLRLGGWRERNYPPVSSIERHARLTKSCRTLLSGRDNSSSS